MAVKTNQHKSAELSQFRDLQLCGVRGSLVSFGFAKILGLLLTVGRFWFTWMPCFTILDRLVALTSGFLCVLSRLPGDFHVSFCCGFVLLGFELSVAGCCVSRCLVNGQSADPVLVDVPVVGCLCLFVEVMNDGQSHAVMMNLVLGKNVMKLTRA